MGFSACGAVCEASARYRSARNLVLTAAGTMSSVRSSSLGNHHEGLEQAERSIVLFRKLGQDIDFDSYGRTSCRGCHGSSGGPTIWMPCAAAIRPSSAGSGTSAGTSSGVPTSATKRANPAGGGGGGERAAAGTTTKPGGSAPGRNPKPPAPPPRAARPPP